jgi:hypothetical protein
MWWPAAYGVGGAPCGKECGGISGTKAPGPAHIGNSATVATAGAVLSLRRTFAMALPKWTQPGFLGKIFRSGAHENFAIQRKANANVPLSLQVDEVQLRWEDNSWANLNVDEQPREAIPSATELGNYKKENEQLRIECEILMHMLTQAEIAKTKKEAELAARKQTITTLLERVDRMKAEGKL